MNEDQYSIEIEQACDSFANGGSLEDATVALRYIVSPDRLAEMRPEYRACSFAKDNYFEEDVAWCAVALQWPQYFGGDDWRRASQLYECVYAPRRPAGEAKPVNGQTPRA